MSAEYVHVLHLFVRCMVEETTTMSHPSSTVMSALATDQRVERRPRKGAALVPLASYLATIPAKGTPRTIHKARQMAN